MKRSLDLLLGTLALVVLSPVMVIAAGSVALTSPGSPLFGQERVGRDGVRFRMWKFRTMYAGRSDEAHRAYVTALLRGEAKDGGTPGVYKLCDDERVTPVGSFLRRSSLDELPQLVNVLLGHMSLVGPRPALPWEAELFTPHQARRSAVKPGITGLWQVRGRSALTMQEALALDVEYVERWSLRLDGAILLRTIPALVWAGVTGRGTR